MTKDAPAQEDAEDAALDEEEDEVTAKTYGNTIGRAEDEDDQRHREVQMLGSR